MTMLEKITLSQSVKTEIDHWLTKYPADQKRSALPAALRLVQEENKGYLSEPLMDAVADYLGLEPIAVYEVASFYSMFNLSPVGKYELNVCTNISCMLNGANDIVAHLKERLDVGLNETTTDGKFTLREVECLAACAGAPAMQVGKSYHEYLTPEKIDQLLKELE